MNLEELALCETCPASIRINRNWVTWLYSSLWVEVTNYHKLCGLKQQILILSQFWRLEVQSQGVDKATFPLKDLDEDLFYASPLDSVVAGNPWYSLACRHYHSNLSLCLHVAFFPVFVHLPISLFVQGHQLLGIGTTLIQYDLILITAAKILLPNKVIGTRS